jgi:limonene-1,2-epoxide hydrolase
MATPIEIVTAFIAEWGKSNEAMLAAYRRYFTTATVWENVGLTVSTGVEEALAVLKGFEPAFGVHYIKVDMLYIAAAGNVVLTERLDRMIDKQGIEAWTVRLMGVFEVENGKIARWREYFDNSAIPQPKAS